MHVSYRACDVCEAKMERPLIVVQMVTGEEEVHMGVLFHRGMGAPPTRMEPVVEAADLCSVECAIAGLMMLGGLVRQ